LFLYMNRMLPGMNHSGMDSLGVQGGNMFVSGDICFLGMDERFRSGEKSDDYWIKLVFGDDDARKRVIWVGTREPSHSYGATHSSAGRGVRQPVFHLDLFFSPIGFSQDKMEFSFLFADYEDIQSIGGNDSPLERRRLAELRGFLRRTLSNLEADLREMGLIPKLVLVPMGVQFNDGLITGYTPFLNGLIDNRAGEKFYLMPCFVDDGQLPEVIKSMQDRAKRSVSDAIPVVVIEDNLLNPWSLGTASVRCRSKVLSRSH